MAAERGGMDDPVGPRVDMGPGVGRGGIDVPIPGGLNFAGWDAPTWAANVRGAFAGAGVAEGTGQTGTGVRRNVRVLRRTSSEPPRPNPRHEPEVDTAQQSPSFGRTPEREDNPRAGTRRRFEGDSVPNTPGPQGGRAESDPGAQSGERDTSGRERESKGNMRDMADLLEAMRKMMEETGQSKKEEKKTTTRK